MKLTRRAVMIGAGALASVAALGGAALAFQRRRLLLASCIGPAALTSGAVSEYLEALAEDEAERGYTASLRDVVYTFAVSTTVAAWERDLGPLEFTGLYRIGDASCANQLAAQAAPDLPS